jgi:Na+-driven multidrug efflux pump
MQSLGLLFISNWIESHLLMKKYPRRYFQAQGLLHVPAMINIIVAPINVALNFLLVRGPEPIRLG